MEFFEEMQAWKRERARRRKWGLPPMPRSWDEEKARLAVAREKQRRREAGRLKAEKAAQEAKLEAARNKQRTWRAENRERVNSYHNARNATPAGKVAQAIRRATARIKARGGCKPCGSVKLLGCSIYEARGHIEAQFLPGMTWDNHGEWHIDHIRPIAGFDLTDPEQVRACAHYTNLQPLWAIDNLRKGGRVEAA